MKSRALRGLAAAAVLALAPAAAADRFLLQDGRVHEGVVVSIQDGTCRLAHGEPIPLAQVKTLDLAPVGKPAGKLQVHLAGGDLLHCDLAERAQKGLAVKSALVGGLQLPMQVVSLVDFGGAGEIPQEEAGGEDVLYCFKAGTTEIVRLKGALEAVGPGGVEFFWTLGSRKVTLPIERVRGLRPARQRAADKPRELVIRLVLTDGSTLSGGDLVLSATQATLQQQADLAFSLPRKSVARIAVSSDWVLVLADHKPSQVEVDRLYGNDLLPAFRSGTSIWGAPLANGIGTYATTRLSWDIRSRYKTFEASVWVPQLSDTAGLGSSRPQGEVIFRVFGDGKKLYDSGLVKGGEKPRPVKVDIEGVRLLSLEADRGPGWGVGDAANWGEAKVRK